MKREILFSDAVKERLKGLNIQIVYLFGSLAEGTAHPMSDIDIGIVMDYKSLCEDTTKLYNELFDIFTDIFPNESIDIVFLQRVGLEINFDVICHGKILFEADADFRDSYEHRVQMLYMDFKPILKEFDEQVLEKI